MLAPNIPGNDLERIKDLQSYKILDTAPEEVYNEIVELASYICQTPIALISLIDSERQWFKANKGLPISESKREIAFCAHAINEDELFIVSDAAKDERFHDNPFVTDSPNIKFYAGAQLKSKEGFNLGTLCVIDNKPRELSVEQKKALNALSREVVARFELRKKNLENEELLSMLKKANEELRKINENKDKLFSILSHDLRGPFTGILGLSEILKDEYESLTDEEKKNYIERLNTISLDYYRLVDNILKWSRLQLDRVDLTKEDLNLHSLIEKIIKLFHQNAESKKINLINSVDSRLQISADKNATLSVIQNLTANAIKFTENEGEVSFSAEQIDGRVELKISDTGVGMNEEELNYLFKKDKTFTKYGTANEKGSGLGLIISKDFMEKQGGDIKVSSQAGKGTQFTVILPS